jgi:hypothetical protein
MADILEVHTAVLLREIDRLKAIYPELSEDPELLAGMIEGETNFDSVLERVVTAFLDMVSMKDAVALRMSALRERGERFDRKAEALKSLAYAIMQHAEKTMVRLPVATLSMAKGRARVVIDDLDQIPQGYVKTERVPLKTEILATLQAEGNLPGAHLEQGEATLSIRTK